MSSTPSPSVDDQLRTAGPVLVSRQTNPTGTLSPDEKNALQEATLAVVREFRQGHSAEEIQLKLTNHGWQDTVADGFIALVSQLLAKMYQQRTYIFAAMAVVTSMIASIALPQAAAGEFPWLAAILSLGIAIICVLGTLRNYQLYRRYRQRPTNKAEVA